MKYHKNYITPGSIISLKTRLACSLRWLAGGCYIDICFEFGVAPGSFYVEGGVLWGTLDMIDRAFQIGFPFDDDSELRNIAAGFPNFLMVICVTVCLQLMDGFVAHAVLLPWK
jgi:hypothetical protein